MILSTMSFVIEKNITSYLKSFTQGFSRTLLISEKAIYQNFQLDFQNLEITPIYIQSGEENKNISTICYLLDKFIEHKLDRDSLIVALGGGVVLDASGFAASIFMRGIAYLSIPTTLLAMCDASLGGKTGINYLERKNYIGTFYPPLQILIHSPYLHTLSHRQFASGLVEVIKHGLLYEPLLKFLEIFKEPILQKKAAILDQMIEISLKVKTSFVEKDPLEKNDRRIFLNFGHTLAHALESLNPAKTTLHGEAVALGLLFELLLSQTVLGTSNIYLDRVIQLFIDFNVPLPFPSYSMEELYTWMKRDKKNKHSEPTFILFSTDGSPLCYQTSDLSLLQSTYMQLKDICERI